MENTECFICFRKARAMQFIIHMRLRFWFIRKTTFVLIDIGMYNTRTYEEDKNDDNIETGRIQLALHMERIVNYIFSNAKHEASR